MATFFILLFIDVFSIHCGKGFGSKFIKQNIVLSAGIILSVDMPVVGFGQGGTAHLEDLVLIGKDGPELLNDSDNRFIVV